MREIVSPLSGIRSPLGPITSILPSYAVLGFKPQLVLDFDDEKYFTRSTKSTFANAITHTRASTATMVDSDGVLKWGPHNLLQRSQEFNVSPWFLNNVTITANNATAPDGTLTAELISNNATTNVFNVGQAITSISGATYTASVFAKAGTNNFIQLVFGNMTSSFANFDLENGVLGTNGGIISSTIENVGNGWYRCSATVTSTGFNSVTILVANSASMARFASYTSAGTETVYLWGASLHRSDLGGMVNNPDRGDSYVPTTTSGVYLPRRGHHVWNGSAWVNEGVLHESEARTNVFSYNKFDDAALQSTSQTLGASVQISGSGSGVTAEVVAVGVEGGIPYFDWDVSGTNTGGGTLFIFIRDIASIAAVDGDTYTVSANLKLISGSVTENNNLQFYCHFQDSGGSLISAPQLAVASSLTSEWQRFHAPLTGSGASISQLAGRGLFLRVPAGGAVNFRVRIGGMQVEKAPTPSSYIPTAGSTVTRAADVMTIPAANLPWPTPEYIGPELGDPDNLDKRADTDGTVTRSGGVINFVNAVSGLSSSISEEIGGLTVGAVYRLSAQIRLVSGNDLSVQVRSGSGGGGITLAPGNFISSSSFANSEVIWVATATSAHFSIRAALGSEFEVQEASYSVREITPLAVSIQMDGRVTYADEGGYSTAVFYRWFDTAADRIVARLDTASARTGQVVFQQTDASVDDTVQTPETEYAPDILMPFNIVARHGSTFINGAVDGTALTANTTPVALPDLSATNLSLGFIYNGTIRTFRIWADDIGDAGLVEATEPSLVPSLSLTFDGTENSFIVEDWSE